LQEEKKDRFPLPTSGKRKDVCGCSKEKRKATSPYLAVRHMEKEKCSVSTLEERERRSGLRCNKGKEKKVAAPDFFRNIWQGGERGTPFFLPEEK